MPWTLIIQLLGTIIQAVSSWHSSDEAKAKALNEDMESHDSVGKALVAMEEAHGHLKNAKV